MSVWKLEELRNLIRDLHGEEQLEKAAGHINAVDWKIRSASYHSFTASTAFDSVFDGDDHPAYALKMMLSSGEEAKKFRESRFVFETNTIACAQAMHSVADILSHVILDSLALKVEDENHLNLKRIQKLLPDGELKESVVHFTGMKPFGYLCDFVNTSKHMRLVDSAYSVDLTGEDKYPHGVRFNEFQGRGRLHPKKWGMDFLEELQQLSIDYVNLGREINAHLERQT